MPDDVLEQEQDQEIEQTQQDEPQTSLPERPAGVSQDRQALIDEALTEGEAEARSEEVINELAEKPGELTLEDLKRLPGAEDMSDAEIQAEWAKAQQTARGEKVETQQTTEEFKLPFPIYDAHGNKIEALDKIGLRDLLSGKLTVGYNALGKEQRKTLAEIRRNASMGHFNEEKYNTALAERNRVNDKVLELQKQVDQIAIERNTWNAALTALAMGNIEPMKKLAQAYQSELTKMPQAAPGMVPISQVEAEQRQVADGQRFITEVIIPAAMDIAKRYDADPKEVAGAIEFMIRRDLGFLTKEKVEQIIQYEVPALFEEKGYTVGGGGAGHTTGGSDELTTLKQQVAALQERVASKANEATKATREKQRKAPPAGGGATPGAGDSMPSFSSRSQMKAWMQGDPNWQKA